MKRSGACRHDRTPLASASGRERGPNQCPPAQAFAEAGADVVFIDALESEAEMRAFTSLRGVAANVPKARQLLVFAPFAQESHLTRANADGEPA